MGNLPGCKANEHMSSVIHHWGQYTEDELAILADMEIEFENAEYSIVNERLSKVHFVSNSKGRGRKRRYPKEVMLIHDTDTPGKWTDYRRFPFDTVSTEVLPQIPDGLEAEAMLMRRFSP